MLQLYYVALRTPTKGEPLGTYNRSIRESQRVKGLRSKLSPKEFMHVCKVHHIRSSKGLVALRDLGAWVWIAWGAGGIWRVEGDAGA